MLTVFHAKQNEDIGHVDLGMFQRRSLANAAVYRAMTNAQFWVKNWTIEELCFNEDAGEFFLVDTETITEADHQQVFSRGVFLVREDFPSKPE